MIFMIFVSILQIHLHRESIFHNSGNYREQFGEKSNWGDSAEEDSARSQGGIGFQSFRRDAVAAGFRGRSRRLEWDGSSRDNSLELFVNIEVNYFSIDKLLIRLNSGLLIQKNIVGE